MIDLHCHLLPGIDDGPETLDQALELARAAVDNGISRAVLTPHLHPERYANQRGNLETAIAQFCAALAAQSIPLQVRLGCEARLCPELLDLLSDDQVPFLGVVDGFRIILLEFPHNMIPVGSAGFVRTLLRMRIRPLIAHPERNKAVMASPDKMHEFTDAGCWLQLTAGSLCGQFGVPAQTTACALIDAGHSCLIASDAHDILNRPPQLVPGLKALQARYGTVLADTLALERPFQIWGSAP